MTRPLPAAHALRKLGISTADYADVSSVETLREAIAKLRLPAVLKTRRFGYDGKGQSIIRNTGDLQAIWAELGTNSAILEQFIPFEREISVIAARGRDGALAAYDAAENVHRDGILHTSTVPAEMKLLRLPMPPAPTNPRITDERVAFSRLKSELLMKEGKAAGTTEQKTTSARRAPRARNASCGPW